ncbi:MULTISPECIES: hypothetical protein [Moorena]|nr:MULTISPECIES: hypothetical protein [Moorena]NEP31314.1 hypothetical protein [Moorena sp. SIO3B2]NEP65903.1 hypothetical protein [Moorena sp. SIO3A5]NEQ05258.1 hypothetical protein [Moorena sp. SIO4E2]OLT68667.1 hypothetical protein BI334_29915 [Moorena producens 3L]
MASFVKSESGQLNHDTQVWDSLKQAIAASSGFQRWQMEHPLGEQFQDYSLDSRVRRYLRETLEMLAY